MKNRIFIGLFTVMFLLALTSVRANADILTSNGVSYVNTGVCGGGTDPVGSCGATVIFNVNTTITSIKGSMVGVLDPTTCFVTIGGAETIIANSTVDADGVCILNVAVYAGQGYFIGYNDPSPWNQGYNDSMTFPIVNPLFNWTGGFFNDGAYNPTPATIFVIESINTTNDSVVTLTDNLFFHYNLSDANDSVDGNDLSEGGIVAHDVGIIGNGSYNWSYGDYYAVGGLPDSLAQAGSGSTVNFWINATTLGTPCVTSGFCSIYGRSAGGANNGDFWFGVTGTGGIIYQRYESGLDSYTTPDVITENDWYMVTMVYLANETTLVYVDGQNIYNFTLSSSSTFNNNTMSIGVDQHVSFFIGMIDEFSAWTRTLNDTEVQTLYNGGTGLPYPFAPFVAPNVSNNVTPGLAANWTFDVAQGNTTHRFDTSGYGRNLTIGGTVTTVNGVHREADSYTSANYTADPINLGTNWSICGFVSTTTANYGDIVSTLGNSSEGGIVIARLNGAGDVSVYMQSDAMSAEFSQWDYTGVLSNGTLEQVCVVYNGTNVQDGVQLYVNATLQNVSTYTDNGLQSLDENDWSGAFVLGNVEDSFIDEVVAYQGQTLSQQNVSDLFASYKETPVIATVTLGVTADNQTLIASVNATDVNYIDQETINWRLFLNDSLIGSGSNGTFQQGVLVNFNNFSTNNMSGLYIIEVSAQDGDMLNSTATNSTALNVTFPSPVAHNLTLSLKTTYGWNISGFDVYINGTFNGTTTGFTYSLFVYDGDYSVKLVNASYPNVTSTVTVAGVDLNSTLTTIDWLGAGSTVDPYRIYTMEQFQAMSSALTSSFNLMNDLNATGFNWVPIIAIFTGRLNGQFHIVNNLTYAASGASEGHVFQRLGVSSNISNIGFIGVNFTASTNGGGGLAGPMSAPGNRVISRVFMTGSYVTTANIHGGFIASGVAGGGTVTVSDVYVNMTTVLVNGGSGSGGFIGGIVSAGFTCSNCYVSGRITPNGTTIRAFTPAVFSGTYTGVFFDNQSTTQVAGGGATAKSTIQMKTQSQFPTYNFTTTWYMGVSGYPELLGFANPPRVSVQVRNLSTNLLVGDYCVKVNGTIQGCVNLTDTNLTMALNPGTYNFTLNKSGYADISVIRNITANVNESFEIAVDVAPVANIILINFTAVNISNNVTINSFCVNGTGTNTSFSICTTNGTAQNNLTGIYNYTAYNASGFQDQTVLNFNFSQNSSIQFNLTQINFIPVVQTTTLVATADNQTLIASANATDGNGDTLLFNWREFRDNIFIGGGTDGPFPQGVNVNFRNFSAMSVNGSYIVEVTATDGINLSNSLNSTAVNVTFPIPLYNLTVKWNDTYNNMYVASFCVSLNGSGAGCTSSGQVSVDVTNATYLIGIIDGTGAYYNVTSVQVVAGDTNVTLSTRPLLQINVTTDKAFYWNATDITVLTQKSDTGTLTASYDYFIDGGAASNTTAVASLSVGTHTATVRVRETVEAVERQANSTASFNITKLTGAMNVQPSGVAFTQSEISINFTAASNNFSAITYDVIVNVNGTNQTVATGLTSPTNTLVNVTETSNGIVYVLAHDTLVTATARNAAVFTVTFVPAISATQFCPTLTSPNEDDMPTTAVIPVTFNVTSYAPFAGETVQVQLSTAGQTANATLSDCSETTISSIVHSYVCNVTMHYYYKAASYSRYINVTINGQSDAKSVATICGYDALLASQRTVDVVSFPTAGPGIVDAIGTPAMVVRNTGNEAFNLSVLAYHLQGRTSPVFLVANDFKVGPNLGSAVTMANGVTTPLNVVVTPASGVQGTVTIYLSMPSNQEIQEYYAPTPWEMVVSG